VGWTGAEIYDADLAEGLDALEFDRVLYRVTLVGDVPVSPDGRPSVAAEGERFLGA
jgi:hypothetical protein